MTVIATTPIPPPFFVLVKATLKNTYEARKGPLSGKIHLAYRVSPTGTTKNTMFKGSNG
jgi:hypothetical protein